MVTKHHINAPVNSQDYKHQWWEDVSPRADLHTVTLRTNIIFLWKVRTIIRILHATFPACHCNISLDQQKTKLAVKIFFLGSTVQFFFNSHWEFPSFSCFSSTTFEWLVSFENYQGLKLQINLIWMAVKSCFLLKSWTWMISSAPQVEYVIKNGNIQDCKYLTLSISKYGKIQKHILKMLISCWILFVCKRW